MKNKREKYIRGFEEFYARNVETAKVKSADYANEDPYSNFRLAELVGVSVEQGLVVRIGDKFSRIANLIGKGSEGEVKDESVTDTLQDMANYCAILAMYIKEKNEETNTKNKKSVRG